MKAAQIGGAALAAGVLIGFIGGENASMGAEQPRRTSLPLKTPVSSSKLVAAREELQALRKQLDAARSANGLPTAAEEQGSQFRELLSREATLKSRKDGAGLLKLLKEFVSMGETAWPSAWELESFLEEVCDKDPDGFGLEFGVLWKKVCGCMVPAADWALGHPESASPEWRRRAVDVIGSADERSGGHARFDKFFDRILREKDSEAAANMARYLSSAGEEDFGKMVAAARAQASNFAAVTHLLEAMGRWDRPSVLEVLGQFAGSGDPILSAEASLQLGRLRPSVAGQWVSSVQEGSPAGNAGIRRGDILRSLNGSPVESDTSWWATWRSLQPDSPVTLVLDRHGESIELNVTRRDLAGQLQHSVVPK